MNTNKKYRRHQFPLGSNPETSEPCCHDFVGIEPGTKKVYVARTSDDIPDHITNVIAPDWFMDKIEKKNQDLEAYDRAMSIL